MISLDQLNVQEKYNLTPIQMAHFLGQLAHESQDFTKVYENLNYSAQRLLEVFPKYFNKSNVNNYARNPQKIANKVYANRMGNGDEKSGDGWKYRGRGYIQLTGKSNYSSFSKFIGEDCVANPDLVETKYAYDSAIWFFEVNNIFSLCKDFSDKTFEAVTRKINGGTNGLTERKAKTLYYYKLLTEKKA